MDWNSISTTDYHTAGEPFRIVTDGVPPLQGRTVMDKRRWALENLDGVRRLLVNEPRGHADMYGCFVCEPDDAGADLGVVFFHNAGYSTACGHGTIALVTWALESGRLGPREQVVLDVPSGRLETWPTQAGGKVTSVRFRNVPSFVFERNRVVAAETVDIAFGGAFYAIAPGVVSPANLPNLIERGRRIKDELNAAAGIVHPLQPDLRDVYGVIFTEGDRNVTVFADGEVDRSPCGSGTSARLALLDATGELARGEALYHRSIVDTVFEGRVVGDAAPVGECPAVVTEVSGAAYLTGRSQFVLDPDDALGTGFLLR